MSTIDLYQVLRKIPEVSDEEAKQAAAGGAPYAGCSPRPYQLYGRTFGDERLRTKAAAVKTQEGACCTKRPSSIMTTHFVGMAGNL